MMINTMFLPALLHVCVFGLNCYYHYHCPHPPSSMFACFGCIMYILLLFTGIDCFINEGVTGGAASDGGGDDGQGGKGGQGGQRGGRGDDIRGPMEHQQHRPAILKMEPGGIIASSSMCFL